MSCGANVVASSGGNTFPGPTPSGGAAVPAFCAPALSAMGCVPLPRLPRSGEEQQERDQQREDAKRFRHGEAEDQASELAVGGGGVAQRTLQELAEQVADADGGSSRADSGKAGADELRG